MSDNVSNQNQGAIMDDSDYAILWDEWMQDVWAEDDDGAQDRARDARRRSPFVARFLDQSTSDAASAVGTVGRPIHMDEIDNFRDDYSSAQRSSESDNEVHDKPLALKYPTSLLCPYDDCGHSRPFKRRYELNRHIRTKHESDRLDRLECPFRGCFKGPNRTTFKRLDKLTDHIRALHRGKQLECPSKGCTMGSMTLDILAIHAAYPHCSQVWTNLIEHAVRKAGTTMYRKCPIWHCHWSSCRLGSRDAYMEHLKIHSHDDLLLVQEELAAENYLYLHHGSEVDAATLAELSNALAPPATFGVVRIRCPVCLSAFFKTHRDLEEHIDVTHLISAEHREHFKAWRTHLRDYRKRHSYAWYADKTTRCPYCSYSSTPNDYWQDKHYLTMLADPETIKPFREQILKSYAGFEKYHAVWNDIRS